MPVNEREGPPEVPGASIADLERYAILKTLEACGGSTSRAALILGISTRKVQYKLHQYGSPAATSEGSSTFRAGESDPGPSSDEGES